MLYLATATCEWDDLTRQVQDVIKGSDCLVIFTVFDGVVEPAHEVGEREAKLLVCGRGDISVGTEAGNWVGGGWGLWRHFGWGGGVDWGFLLGIGLRLLGLGRLSRGFVGWGWDGLRWLCSRMWGVEGQLRGDGGSAATLLAVWGGGGLAGRALMLDDHT